MSRLTEAQTAWMQTHTNFEIVKVGVSYEVMAELYGDGRVAQIVDGRTKHRPGPSVVVVGVPAKTAIK